MIRIMGAAIVLLLAGCFEAQSEAPAPLSDESARMSRPDAEVFAGLATALGCEELETGFLWPLDTLPWEAPPGWERDETQPASSVVMDLLDCPDFHWAGENYGPVRMVIERHNGISVPEPCREPVTTATQYWMLLSWRVDRRDLAERMAMEMGLPMVFATIDRVVDQGPVTSESWNWSVPQGPRSSLGLEQAGPPLEYQGYAAFQVHMFWFMEDRVAAATMVQDGNASALEATPAQGVMGDDMFMHHFSPTYASDGSTWRDVSLNATVRRYADRQCGSP
jgi:hypothetical protein